MFAPPYHPYTEAFASAVPIADPAVKTKRVLLEGEVPSATSPPSGCPFQARCRWKHRVRDGRCETMLPPMRELRDGHFIKSHLKEQVLNEMEPLITLEPRRAESSGGTGPRALGQATSTSTPAA